MYQFALLSAAGILNGMSEMRHGSQSPRYTRTLGECLENRRRFLDELSLCGDGYHPLFMSGNGVAMRGAFVSPITPGDEIRVVGYDDRQRGMFASEDEVLAEALVTRDRGLFLHVTIADCLGAVLVDPKTGTLALAHVSRVTTSYTYRRKGSEREGIPPLLARLVDCLEKGFGVDPADLIIGLSPCISGESYQLGWFANSNEPEWKDFCRPHPNGEGWLVDLAGFSRALLLSKGARPEHIEVAGLDTVAARDGDGQFRYFSHLRSDPNRGSGERPEGRNAFVVGMPLR